MLRNLSGALIERLKGRWLSIAVTLVLVYFGYHAVHGRYGLLAWIDTSRDLAAAEEQLAALVDQRERLAADVAAFQPDSLDRDRLEEQLRLLGYVRPNEVVVLRRDEAPAQ